MKTQAAFAFLAAFLPLALAAAPAQQESLRVGASTIQVNLEPDLPLPTPVVMEWIGRAATAVSNYLGRFPVKHVTITIEPGGGEAVNDGLTTGGSTISVHLGRRAKKADLDDDWIMTHEMFHLAFPTLKVRYLWMMEGLSDYLEPLARGRVGQLTPQQVWLEYAQGLPEGLPQTGDQGLDNTPTRERIYWGGNLFWLLADVRIREQTGNRHSVDDVIRAILKDGGDGSAEWSLDKVLDMARKATGTTVLKDLHDELGPKPGNIDLTDLWKRMGVVYRRRRVTFDDTAPLAAIRASITAPNGTGPATMPVEKPR